jgi:methylated-DNA-[protein]-cysteine S-methyltransferase
MRLPRHVDECARCRRALEEYRAIERAAASLRDRRVPAGPIAESRSALEARLTELSSRLVSYRVFASPLGRILIGRSERGVSLVEYLFSGRTGGSVRARFPQREFLEDGDEIEPLWADLRAYFEGRAASFDWPLDLGLVRSDFWKEVLRATLAIPYGAVQSYAKLAGDVGRPQAARAVAQALRWNPLPIVIPCHRVIGSSGSLTGYAGNKIHMKERLLNLEGVPTRKFHGEVRIARESMYVSRRLVSYCLPTCKSALRPSSAGAATFFGSRERAEAAGLVPCEICRPDLHPIGA